MQQCLICSPTTNTPWTPLPYSGCQVAPFFTYSLIRNNCWFPSEITKMTICFPPTFHFLNSLSHCQHKKHDFPWWKTMRSLSDSLCIAELSVHLLNSKHYYFNSDLEVIMIIANDDDYSVPEKRAIIFSWSCYRAILYLYSNIMITFPIVDLVLGLILNHDLTWVQRFVFVYRIHWFITFFLLRLSLEICFSNVIQCSLCIYTQCL